jgi:putative acetyltransferase
MIQLSAYNPDRAAEIIRLCTMVFTDSAGQDEGVLIGDLVRDLIAETDEHDIYGFVAVDHGHIIAAIFFSRLTFEQDHCAFLLSPVAVHTDYQGKGIGQQLIQYGLNTLRAAGVALVMTYGSPKYYAKTGFHPVSEATISAPLPLTHPHGWLGQSLVQQAIEPIAGQSWCVNALKKPEYW